MYLFNILKKEQNVNTMKLLILPVLSICVFFTGLIIFMIAETGRVTELPILVYVARINFVVSAIVMVVFLKSFASDI